MVDSGSIVALVTPFRNSVVDYEALEELIKFQIAAGTDAILVCGTTGEGLLLSDAERDGIIRRSIKVVKGRVPVIVGCSSCWTNDAIKLALQAETLNADAILLIAPYYVKPTQEGIITHFKTVHNSTKIPIIIYNNPGRCAVDMSVNTIAEIAKLPRVIALKDSNTKLTRVNFLKQTAPNLKLFSGDDASLPGYLAHGGDGCISVTANIEPKLVKGLVDAWHDREIKQMQQIATKLAPINEAMFIEPNPIPVKYVLSKRGFIANELRLPLCPAKKTSELEFLLKTM